MDKKLRAKARKWFEESLPKTEMKTLDDRKAWHRKLFDAGFVGMGWPKEYGGQDARPMEQAPTLAQPSTARFGPTRRWACSGCTCCLALGWAPA